MKELVVKLKLDGSGVFPAFANLEKKANALVSGPFGRLKSAIAGAFAIGAIEEAGRRTLAWAGNLTDVATRLGVSTEYVQEMTYALKQSGASMEDLVSFTEKLNRARAAAIAGGPKGIQIRDTFKTQFGIDDTALRGPVQPIIDAIAKSFESGNVQVLTTALSKMGIKGAGAMTGAFADGLAENRKAIRSMGGVVSEDVVEQLDAAGDALQTLATIIQAQIAPAMVKLVRFIAESVNKLQSSGSFLGAGTSNWSFSDWIGNAMLLPVRTITTAIGNAKGMDTSSTAFTDKMNASIAKTLGLSLNQMPKQFDYARAGNAASEDTQAFKEAMRRLDESVAKRNKRRSESGMQSGFESFDKVATPKRQRAESDSLISVGNFLGASRNSIESIGQQTNRLIQTTNDKLDQLIDAVMSGNGDAIDLPEAG